MAGRKWLISGLVAFLIVGFVPYETIRGGGGPKISVIVKVDEPAAWVSCEVVWREQDARAVLQDLASEEFGLWFDKQLPFENKPLTVRVPTSEHSTRALLWSRSYRGQARHLVVLVGYPDGRRAGKFVELPDVREVESIHVEVP